MHDHWELLDVYKALLALVAGAILGLEREMKEKVAGLKTITIICLGAALFGILSYKIGVDRPTHIAAYVVSGVGFIGAGAIFKDGFTISGLTTAGIIWLAAAVGLSIGFGEFFLAGTFMIASMFIIFSTPLINKIFVGKKSSKPLEITIAKKDAGYIDEVITGIRSHCIHLEHKKINQQGDQVSYSIEVFIHADREKALHNFLLGDPRILSFSL